MYNSRDTFCRRCSSRLIDVGSGKFLLGMFFCNSCASNNSELDLLNEELEKNKRHTNSLFRIIANNRKWEETLNHEIQCIQNKVRSREHLRPVNEGMTDKELKKIHLKYPHGCNTSRLRMIDEYKLIRDRRAILELTFSSVNCTFTAKIYRKDKLYYEVPYKKSRKSEIRRLIDTDNGLIFPWASIERGTPWIAEVDLNAYFLYDLETPENVVEFSSHKLRIISPRTS
jgi:hypothetical protein